jgi:hypothetical protein
MVTVIAYYKALLRYWLGNVFSCFLKNKKIMDFDDGVIMCFPRVRRLYVLIPMMYKLLFAVSPLTMNEKTKWLLLH